MAITDRLRNRLAELKAEFDKGQAKLAELEGQAREVQHTLLRISGAVQVLEEELAHAATPHPVVVDMPHAREA
jgi:prefoldin subunit 5